MQSAEGSEQQAGRSARANAPVAARPGTRQLLDAVDVGRRGGEAPVALGDDSRLERLGRVARKSLSMPLGQAFVAQNALDGIAYRMPDEVGADLEESVRVHLLALLSGASPREQLSLLDLAWVCAGRMAPKSFDPLRRLGVMTLYPFLEPPVVAVSSSLSWEDKCAAGEEKALLKALLAHHVPREWVYRAKTGFTPPYREIFTSPGVQEYLHGVVLSQQNPLLNYCRSPEVRQLVERVCEGRSVCSSAYDFLWALTFSSAWVCQLPKGGCEPGKRVRQPSRLPAAGSEQEGVGPAA